MHAPSPPSPWVQRFAALLRPGARVLDVACGSGRHVTWLAARGFAVTGVDRDAGALAAVEGQAELLVADLEAGPWPLPGRRFDAVVVTNYLWRPLLPQLLASLAEGGIYLHETFADGHQHIGRPARPDFLLRHGELLQACAGLRIVAFEDGFEAGAEADADGGAAGGRCVQRIAAVNEAPGAAVPPRYALDLLPRAAPRASG
ncbi:MAG: SAM-dependent methyltransferase [Leptothrix sp. (in: Bacteria)]|nr:SAM-dependent methyltransferase [Leptothrix sp. (in: b-proteobacteria)]